MRQGAIWLTVANEAWSLQLFPDGFLNFVFRFLAEHFQNSLLAIVAMLGQLYLRLRQFFHCELLREFLCFFFGLAQRRCQLFIHSVQSCFDAGVDEVDLCVHFFEDCIAANLRKLEHDTSDVGELICVVLHHLHRPVD